MQIFSVYEYIHEKTLRCVVGFLKHKKKRKEERNEVVLSYTINKHTRAKKREMARSMLATSFTRTNSPHQYKQSNISGSSLNYKMNIINLLFYIVPFVFLFYFSFFVIRHNQNMQIWHKRKEKNKNFTRKNFEEKMAETVYKSSIVATQHTQKKQKL